MIKMRKILISLGLVILTLSFSYAFSYFNYSNNYPNYTKNFVFDINKINSLSNQNLNGKFGSKKLFLFLDFKYETFEGYKLSNYSFSNFYNQSLYQSPYSFFSSKLGNYSSIGNHRSISFGLNTIYTVRPNVFIDLGASLDMQTRINSKVRVYIKF
ncbi:MAG: hypothetical protein ABDH21_06605 [bacterium]